MSYHTLKTKIEQLFKDNKEIFLDSHFVSYKTQRLQSFQQFVETGLPHRKLENWKKTNLSEEYKYAYFFPLKPEKSIRDFDKVFNCQIHDFNTEMIKFFNGWSVDNKLQTLENGVLAGNLKTALKERPDLVKKYFLKAASKSKEGLTALNTAMALDGTFIYVPDNTEINLPLQVVDAIRPENNLFIQSRNLIIVGKNSKLTFIHCDDSLNQERSFTNAVSEIFLEENAKLDYYKLQNLNDHSTLINSAYFHLKKNASLTTFSLTFNGGKIRNNIDITLAEEGANTDVNGLYLVDKKQHIDNHVFIDHKAPNCHSNELFKGIIDESAKAIFKGHILVRQDAQNTQADQINRNLLITDKASAHTNPFLEIYADDVKCSHGATVGQLDEDAMFYLRSRGISKYNALQLMMYAFAAEVSNKITIPILQVRVDDMIKKRLRGELSVCDQCVLLCSKPESSPTFDIDYSKI